MDIPLIGLGTYKLSNPYETVKRGLAIGYRHIDTASLYKSEAAVGRAIRDSSIDRREIFVTTKICTKDILNNKIEHAVKKSLERLNIEYIDLVLLHAPIKETIEASWLELERCSTIYPIRKIGVSNYNIQELSRVLTVCQTRPYVNQIEMSPFLTRKALTAYCRNHHIKVVAHSSLTRGEKLGHPALVELANSLNMTPSQLILKWQTGQGIAVIPTSDNSEHLLENYKTLDYLEPLDSDTVKTIDSLNNGFTLYPKYCLNNNLFLHFCKAN